MLPASAVITDQPATPPPAGVADSSLGNIAKIASTVCQSRKLRYYLQSLSRQLLPDERVSQCLRTIAPGRYQDGVHVVYSPKAQKARYRNLVVCSRLWTCPVCAARITEERRKELAVALARAKDSYKTVLVTYTLRHTLDDKLGDLLAGLLESFRSLKSGRGWQWIKEEHYWAGSVRSLETTHGSANGWHVHLHELVLLDANCPDWAIPVLESDLRELWDKALAKHGYDATWERGVVVEASDDRIREYVAKYGHDPIDGGWTVEHELTKAPSKVGAGQHGRTPFQMLADFGNGDEAAGRLFKEYAAAFKGRNQLVWSRGLRALLGLGEEATDEELADCPFDETEFVLAQLTPMQWRTVLALDLRAELLDVAGEGDENRLWDWLRSIGVPYTVMVNINDLVDGCYELPSWEIPKIHDFEQRGGEATWAKCGAVSGAGQRANPKLKSSGSAATVASGGSFVMLDDG